jgi:hypothetical protein
MKTESLNIPYETAPLIPSEFPGLKFRIEACSVRDQNDVEPFTVVTVYDIKYIIENLTRDTPDFSELYAIDAEMQSEIKRVVMLNKDTLIQYFERAGRDIGIVWLIENFKVS